MAHADRDSLIQKVLGEAGVYNELKFEFQHFTTVSFESISEIFKRHNCLQQWTNSKSTFTDAGFRLRAIRAKWAETSTTTLNNLYTDLHVTVVKAQQEIGAIQDAEGTHALAQHG